MMKRREFDNEKEARAFFYRIDKMTSVIYKSFNAEIRKYVVEWKWSKKYFEKNK